MDYYTLFVDLSTNRWLLRRQGGYHGLQSMSPSEDEFLTPTAATERCINFYLWHLLLWQLTVRIDAPDDYNPGYTRRVDAYALYGDQIPERSRYAHFGYALLCPERWPEDRKNGI